MATTGNLTTQLFILRGLVTREQYILILEYAAEMGTVLSLLGVISNIIIIRTFVTMGINDGVIVSFLSLAVFDLFYLIAGVSLGITIFILPIQPFGLSIYFTNIMILVNVTNVLATTYLAVARSMCVARPLQFKNTFTRERATMFMIIFAFSSIAIYSPILANMGMSVKFDKQANRSRSVWWGSPSREAVKEVVWLLIEVILPLITQVIIIICVFIMTASLRASSRFRQASLAVSGKVTQEATKTENNLGKEAVNNLNTHTIPLKRINKEVRVVQQVVLISVVYIVCNIPKLLISLGSMCEPNFTIGRRYTYLYMSLNGIRTHFEQLNSAVNVLIYYKYNTKFRATLFAFGRKSQLNHN
ncbi:unnamed protein product [Candidula unifasciata]|uniref:G-protein coupled receptors family 1 profile domain-containing protein n=1 Tax=Candidula unifasciata TaxID=100452 RepID=A0A8S3ZS89_9EUPU|nr:unnamed protein product [Candidula unifasciata]